MIVLKLFSNSSNFVLKLFLSEAVDVATSQIQKAQFLVDFCQIFLQSFYYLDQSGVSRGLSINY